jgi:gliding motility-associated-like protein
VEIFPLIDPLFTAPVPDCFSTHAFDFQVVASNIPETQYVWDFGGPVDDVNIQGGTVVNLHYAEPGTYAVTVTASANGCDVSHTETVWAIADPTIGFTGGPVSGCPPHPVSFTNLSTTETATSYLWHFGDGSTSPAASPSYVYTTSGNFSVTLEMTTGGFCPRNLVLEMPGFIDILPVPQAGFDIEPNEVDLLNPVVTVTSLAEEGVECFYYFGDGGSLAACDGIYTYTDGGLFDVTQTVVNAAGCTSTAVGQVAVNGTIFYAPNAFSPNNDGINDVWLPVALGTEGYRVEIFDRWGERIWSADRPGIPWLGSVGDGTHYVPDGVYFWKVWLQDQVLQPQTHSGTLQVIR